jgi:hypothetical protein
MPKIKTANELENRKVVSHEDWLKARLELLAAEKEPARQVMLETGLVPTSDSAASRSKGNGHVPR